MPPTERGAAGTFGSNKRKRDGGVGDKRCERKGTRHGLPNSKNKEGDEAPTRAAKTAATTSIARGLNAPSCRNGLSAKLDTVTSDAGRRQAIAVHFVYEHEAAPNGKKKCWEGQNGIAMEVAKAMPFAPDHRTVRSVMEAVVECVRCGIECDPERKRPGNGNTMGKAACVGLNTRHARIIADTIEAGLGIRTALSNVNAALSEDGVKVAPPATRLGTSAAPRCQVAATRRSPW